MWRAEDHGEKHKLSLTTCPRADCTMWFQFEKPQLQDPKATASLFCYAIHLLFPFPPFFLVTVLETGVTPHRQAVGGIYKSGQHGDAVLCSVTREVRRWNKPKRTFCEQAKWPTLYLSFAASESGHLWLSKIPDIGIPVPPWLRCIHPGALFRVDSDFSLAVHSWVKRPELWVSKVGRTSLPTRQSQTPTCCRL
jgi:hypothetical protein